jgi:hypothetical protein
LFGVLRPRGWKTSARPAIGRADDRRVAALGGRGRSGGRAGGPGAGEGRPRQGEGAVSGRAGTECGMACHPSVALAATAAGPLLVADLVGPSAPLVADPVGPSAPLVVPATQSVIANPHPRPHDCETAVCLARRPAAGCATIGPCPASRQRRASPPISGDGNPALRPCSLTGASHLARGGESATCGIFTSGAPHQSRPSSKCRRSIGTPAGSRCAGDDRRVAG